MNKMTPKTSWIALFILITTLAVESSGQTAETKSVSEQIQQVDPMPISGPEGVRGSPGVTRCPQPVLFHVEAGAADRFGAIDRQCLPGAIPRPDCVSGPASGSGTQPGILSRFRGGVWEAVFSKVSWRSWCSFRSSVS